MKIRKTMAVFCLILVTICTCGEAFAGILAEKTRVIYAENNRERSLMLVNTNPWPVIVQTWSDDGRGSSDYPDSPFIVTPAIFRLEPKQMQGIRITYNDTLLPGDRESVYWLNIYEVPPVDKRNEQHSYLTMTMNTQIKIFYRPATLTKIDDIASRMSFSAGQDQHGSFIECHNPTPYHISFTDLYFVLAQKEIKARGEMDMMTNPKSSKRYYLSEPAEKFTGGHTKFYYITDSGVIEYKETAITQTQ